MRSRYDSTTEKREAGVAAAAANKVRITIRLDRDILGWFRAKVEEQGRGNYQTMLNDALRAYMVDQQQQPLEELLRRVVREELNAIRWKEGETKGVSG